MEHEIFVCHIEQCSYIYIKANMAILYIKGHFQALSMAKLCIYKVLLIVNLYVDYRMLVPHYQTVISSCFICDDIGRRYKIW